MRKPIITVVVLALVSAATALSTRSVVGAGRKAQRVPPRRVATTLTITSQPRLTITRAVGGPGRFEIAAEASVGDTRSPKRLAWHLRAFRVLADRRRELVWHERYDAQPLLVPAGVVLSPTFREGLIMPPGDYAVQVGIEDLDLAAAVQAGTAPPLAHLVVTKVARLTVQ